MKDLHFQYGNHRDSFTGVTDHDRAMTNAKMAIMLKEERYGDFGKTFRSRTLLEDDRGRGLSVRHGDHIMSPRNQLDQRRLSGEARNRPVGLSRRSRRIPPAC